jgi:hypothetical protein
VRMVRGPEPFRFALKPREPIVISGDRGRQDFDRDLVFQLRVRRAKHLPHAAFAELGGDLVDAEAGAGSEGQVVGLYGERHREIGPGKRRTVHLARVSHASTGDTTSGGKSTDILCQNRVRYAPNPRSHTVICGDTLMRTVVAEGR